MKYSEQPKFLKFRFYGLVFGLLVICSCLISRIVYLTIVERQFLLHQGNARSIRMVQMPAFRGVVKDRNNIPLAVSTPVQSIWINPNSFNSTAINISRLSQILNISDKEIENILQKNSGRQFAYLVRNISPMLADEVKSLGISGINFEKTYKRYYPAGEVSSQLIGFTDIDDNGQEGIEIAYNHWLSGTSGLQKVLEDRFRRLIAVLNTVRLARAGRDLTLSIDSRIQYISYQVLKETCHRYFADSGSLVVLDVKTGEVIAIVNVPSFNPNDRQIGDIGQFRNRAATDMFEPGSTMKVFSIASALDSEKYVPLSTVNTNPGWFMIGKNQVKDDRLNHGIITLTQVLQKSSNVGIAKITLSLPPEHLIDVLRRVGFGVVTGSGFPGESPGLLVEHKKWNPFVLATLAFGYGVSVTPLQLARAYSVIANNGMLCPISLIKQDAAPICTQAIKPKIAEQLLKMLEKVVQKGGTGTKAQVKGYRIAGKTGTAYVAATHGYNQSKHVSSFVGMGPVSNPRYVIAVIINNPHGADYGGDVSAPAFAKVMENIFRIYNISPDDLSAVQSL